MASAKKTLTNVNEDITLNIPTDQGAVIGVEYGAGGQGTIVLEGRFNAGGSWFGIQLQKPDGTAAVANLAAAGVGYADVSYCDDVRVRKSVAGAGPVDVFVNLSIKSAL